MGVQSSASSLKNSNFCHNRENEIELLFNNSLIINSQLIFGECADGAVCPPQTSLRILSKTQVDLFDEEDDGDCVLGLFAVPVD